MDLQLSLHGDGIVFDGCILYNNADDGWDLFAKVETGAIGTVTIKNSVAYMNGYVLDEEGNLVDAGNGNGFKMGGSSITGGHKLINSVAFCNKAKGIDSNSCPDIQVYKHVHPITDQQCSTFIQRYSCKYSIILADGGLFHTEHRIPFMLKILS